MRKFCVRIMERLPDEECLVEAEYTIEALAKRRDDLVEWAETVKIEAYAEEAD